MLKVENIDVYYGAIHAVKNVSFEVGDGEIVALIGANGAGKSTILKTVSGLMHPRTGTITFCDQNITHTEAYKLLRTRHGVDDQTNIARMERQNLVLEAATKKLHTLSGNDCIVAFNAVSDYAVTDLGSAEILELKELTDQYQQLPSLHIEGEAFLQGEFMAFEPDADSLQNAILQLFYTKKEMR